MRRIKTFARVRPGVPRRTAIVYYHADWGEYFVRFWIDGIVQRKAFYPADDEADAMETAEFFVERDA